MSARTEVAQDTPAPLPLLSRDAILASEDLPSEYLDVPDWGGRVKVRGMTGTERDAWEADAVSARLKGGMPTDWRVRRVAQCLIDEAGKRLFGDRDVAVLGAKSGAVIDRIDDVVVRLSGLREATAEVPSSEDQAVAELGKGESGASGSD